MGTIARYGTGLWINQDALSNHSSPGEPFAINLTGCLVIGLLALHERTQSLRGIRRDCSSSPGLLGGFTTFSRIQVGIRSTDPGWSL